MRWLKCFRHFRHSAAVQCAASAARLYASAQRRRRCWGCESIGLNAGGLQPVIKNSQPCFRAPLAPAALCYLHASMEVLIAWGAGARERAVARAQHDFHHEVQAFNALQSRLMALQLLPGMNAGHAGQQGEAQRQSGWSDSDDSQHSETDTETADALQHVADPVPVPTQTQSPALPPGAIR